jgi:sarcosine oxidase subunit gamma
VSAPIASHEDIAGIVKAAVGDAASVTEQTDGWVRFEITGERCRALFELLCNVDIQRMDAGQATRTQIEHLGTFVLCQTPGTAYSLLTLRSAAASLQHALEAAATAIR